MLLRAGPATGTKVLTKEEEAAVSKFRPLSFLFVPKGPDKCSYREFIVYITEYLIRYKMAVTNKVFNESLPHWVSADP